MKKKIITFTVFLLILVVGFYSCEKPSKTGLKDTKWKLEGIMNVQTGDLKKLEPKDCEECYTFTFNTNTTARGYTVLNEMFISDLNPFSIWGTKIGEEGDAGICYDALVSVKSYTFYKCELKLFYDNNSKYLLYKQVNL